MSVISDESAGDMEGTGDITGTRVDDSRFPLDDVRSSENQTRGLASSSPATIYYDPDIRLHPFDDKIPRGSAGNLQNTSTRELHDASVEDGIGTDGRIDDGRTANRRNTIYICICRLPPRD